MRTLQDVGIERAVQFAETMGLGKLPAVPSLALGPGEVSLQSLTAAYAAFANHGLLPRPSVIRRVEDRAGRVLYRSQAVKLGGRCSDETAFLMSSLLADVVNSGTGARARAWLYIARGWEDRDDKRFQRRLVRGYTPKLVAGVWIGFDEPRTIMPNGFASDVAVPLWANFMKRATHDDAPEWILAPANITSVKICRFTGKLATPHCEHAEMATDGPDEHRATVYTEYFVRGTEPTTTAIGITPQLVRLNRHARQRPRKSWHR